MNKQILFESKEQVDNLRKRIINTTNTKLKDLWQSGEGIDFLRKVKFEPCGYDPLFEHGTNFIEQTNQTFTYLVCLEAVSILLSKYPSHRFMVNFGTESGFDVVSEDESIICECFAATTPSSNKKLELDVLKVYTNKTAVSKYVIYYVATPKEKHVENIKDKYSGVEVIALKSL
ncbi:MAG: hypothetical protein ACOX4Q_11170 [Syntrophomonadales bacterium]